ncbi:PCC domain-containing protein [Denitrobaculum tricleocarpae]|uniref:DNA-binding protein n=1 Tax=Denitrobaculum tricleocarpae TaxID=2591009 RepID=A0A545TXK6_9PROT|nr:PPC domain-containing DNA-binding protein [Denitrobaculum tricleocarpae]TQV81930.1 DNA-binding protein [Denitrobaculum tricleocarpae]
MTRFATEGGGQNGRRRIEQPGAPLSPRRICVRTETGPELRLELDAGMDLLPELATVLSTQGVRSAALQALSGHFDKVSYFTGMADETGARVATYGAARVLQGPVLLLGANAIFGIGEEGVPLVHCHAVLADAQGRVHGGHLPLEGCILGSQGAVIMATPLEDAGFEVAFDSETNYSLFHPTVMPV